MKIKVCGMRDPKNLEKLLQLPVDYVGLIFYEKSKRFVDDVLPNLNFFDKERVGVFVNATDGYILEKSKKYGFITIQLHGDESPNFCKKLKLKGFKIIKTFSVNEKFDFSKTKRYEPFCDYFLFDTKGKLPGGNGVTFDWDLLKEYEGRTPFFLSGGISSNHLNLIKALTIKQLYAVDVNSGFEIEPAKKDISLLKKFIEDVKSESSIK